MKVKTTVSVKNEEKENSKWDFCILNLPEYRRQPPQEYSPVAWRFGLHNRENLDTNGSEAMKISYADALGLVGDELYKFCNAVVVDPKSMLRCYGLQEQATNWSEEVIKYVLALDALILALVFDLSEDFLWTFEQQASVGGDILLGSRSISWIDSIANDICQYENQIPFELIQRASKYLRKLKLEIDLDQVPRYDYEAEVYIRWENKMDCVRGEECNLSFYGS